MGGHVDVDRELFVAYTFSGAILVYFIGDLISTFYGFRLGFVEANGFLSYYFGETPVRSIILMKVIIIFYFFTTSLYFVLEKHYMYAFANSLALFLIGLYATIANSFKVFLGYT